MICALCLNPCIDKTVEIDSFTYGGMNRIRSSRQDGSGKGVNVAVVCKTLGLDSTCLGFLYRENGHMVQQRLTEVDCPGEFIWLDGAVRINTKVLDLSRQVITELNESGTPVSQNDLDAMLQLAAEYSRKCSIMALCGSLPPGCPNDFYRRIIEAADKNCRILLDADGEKLTQGLAGKPYFIKPNQYELELLLGRKLNSLDEIKSAALSLIDQGIGIVAVSMGGDGAMITNGKETYFAPRVPIEVLSTVGAGDSMIAGFLYGLEHDLPLKDLFHHGVAAGTAACMTAGTQLVRLEDYQKVWDSVQIAAI